jgi:hypothetical protein
LYIFFNKNRLNCIKILNWHLVRDSLQANVVKSGDTIENQENENLFTICLNAERIPASLDEYREKLYHLQRLDPEICKKYFTKNDSSQLQEVYLINFSLK